MLQMFENSFNQGYVCDTFLVVLIQVSYIEVFCGSTTNAANVASSVAVLVRAAVLAPQSLQCWSPQLQCWLLPREISSQLSPPHSHLPPHVEQLLAKQAIHHQKSPKIYCFQSEKYGDGARIVGTNPYCEFPPAIGRLSEGFISRQVSGLLYIGPSTLFPHHPSRFHMGES